ncbi:MAG: F0F1 ATP synthase subunit epsilon [Fimbriimonas sp.]|nr:F0F1 ATP synthase subunit epsilon [Fimbriimonas sp.]
MNLKVLLPFRVFLEKADVSRIVVETIEGSFGLLPHRLDCVAPLVPGILTYEMEGKAETYVAIDRGVLVKEGPNVIISVRQAIAGAELEQLKDSLEKQFLTLDEQEQKVRIATAKLESGFVRRFASLQHE